MDVLYTLVILAMYTGGVIIAANAADAIICGKNPKSDNVNFIVFLVAVAFLVGQTFILKHAYNLGAASVTLPSLSSQ